MAKILLAARLVLFLAASLIVFKRIGNFSRPPARGDSSARLPANAMKVSLTSAVEPPKLYSAEKSPVTVGLHDGNPLEMAIPTVTLTYSQPSISYANSKPDVNDRNVPVETSFDSCSMDMSALVAQPSVDAAKLWQTSLQIQKVSEDSTGVLLLPPLLRE